MKKTKMLKKNYEFRQVLSKGKYYSGECIEAFVKKNSEKNKVFNFLGIAVSSKAAKAVKRNYIKRLIRENYRLLEKDLILSNSIVFLWKKKVSTENASFYSIKEDMKKIFDKAKLFGEKK